MTIAATLPELSLSALALAAAACDVRSRRIPNWMVATGMIAALVSQCLVSGLAAGGWAWLTGAATGLALYFGLYLVGGIGAGDVKLMGMVGAFCGPASTLQIALIACLVGGLLAIGLMVVHKASRRGLIKLSNLLLSLPFGAGAIRTSADATQTGTSVKVPFAVAIAVSTLMVVWGNF